MVSDFAFSIRDGVRAINAGMDVELPDAIHYGRRLLAPVRSGEVPMARVDDAVSRLLKTQQRFAEQLAVRPPLDILACAEHQALAREVATKAIVLLRNESVDDGAAVLPLDPDRVRRIAVLGRLADIPNTGDRGSSSVTPPYVVTPLRGLRAALEPLGIEVITAASESAAATAARSTCAPRMRS